MPTYSSKDTYMSDSSSLFPDEQIPVVEEAPKKKRRGPSQRTKTQLQKSQKVSPDAIKEIFEFWKKTFNKKRAILDEKRSKNIGAAIHDYGMETCKEAIIGCSLSDFHMGRNKDKRVYNDIELIFRDATKVERFLAIYDDFQLTE